MNKFFKSFMIQFNICPLFLYILMLLNFVEKAEAVASKEVFQKYSNPVFIETGSYYGDGIAQALETGFKEVYSIELSPYLHAKCVERFQSNPHVHLYQGDSSVVLKDILENLHEQATFWLDGHYSEGETAKGKSCTPILEELALIATHPIKCHTILIDDVRQFGTVSFDFIQLDDIDKALKRINPRYQILFEDGYVPNDILVAQIL